MKRKLRFFLPRLGMLTLAVGLAAFVLLLIFKLLLAVLVLSFIVCLITKIVKSKYAHRYELENEEQRLFSRNKAFSTVNSPRNNSIKVGAKTVPVIIPIN